MMAALTDPEYYGTMMRIWLKGEVGERSKTYVISSDPTLDHEELTETLTKLIEEEGPIHHIHFDRITVGMVDKNEDGHDRIVVPYIKIVEVDDDA
jgi:hypothetical protein